MASYIPLPTSFQESYNDRLRYPTNIIHRTVGTYPSALFEYFHRLNSAAPTLFENDLRDCALFIRDLNTDNGAGKEPLKEDFIYTPDSLAKWFEIKEYQDPENPQYPVVTTRRKDPKCRFVYIYSENSRARLKVARSMLVELLTFHQVMPDYLDYIFAFGLRSEPQDLRLISSFRQQKTLKSKYTSSGIAILGRSGRQFQVCYNLTGVTAKVDDPFAVSDEDIFAVRQAAFYHRFDVIGGNALWIVTKGRLDVQKRFKELTGNDGTFGSIFTTPDQCFRSSLSAHLLFCRWSTEDWRKYLKWLEYTIDRRAGAILGPSDPGGHHHIYTAREVRHLQIWGEKIREIITVLKANVDAIASLRKFYTDLREDEDFPMRRSSSDDISVFARQLDNMMDDFRMQIDRADLLVRITTDRTELVKENRLERLNLNMENEAIIVRIITIVTLVYLPATFVSTFFSTDVVKYQSANSPAGSFSKTAMIRWIELTVPLTFLTFLIAYIGKGMAERRWRREVLAADGKEQHWRGWISALWGRRPRLRKATSWIEDKV